MDQRLVAQAPPLGLPLQRAEHVGVNSNGDQMPRRASQGGTSHAAHGPELLVGRLGEVGEVNPTPSCTPPVPSGSAAAL
jgi:hypothetical protein